MIRSTITSAGQFVRANVFTEHGASTKTCRTVSEARAFIAVASERQPTRNKPTQPPKPVFQIVRNDQ